MKKNLIKVGTVIGKLTVLERAGVFEGKSDVRLQWKVQCECGNVKVMVNRYIQRKGHCGCSRGKVFR